jgi:LysR family transcriptional regulator, glycine cleavage system transcriptional activator
MSRLPPLRLLIAFDAVHRLGSMRLASAELNVTRPAVSQSIRALEDWLGAPLFDRSVKPARPTDAGERLARATQSGLGQIASAIEDIRASAGHADRHITVSCTIGMATYWLMPRLSAFYARVPDAMVSVQAPPSDMPAFSAGIDVALRFGPGPWQESDTVRVFEECACPVGQPERIMALNGDLAALSTQPLIHVRTPAANGWPGWKEYLAAKGLRNPIGQTLTFDNYVQATQAALDGKGILLGWRSINAGILSEGRLAAIEQGIHKFGSSYWASAMATPNPRPLVREFLDWIRDAGADFDRSGGMMS